MLQVAEEEELQVEVGSFCSAFLQEFIMASKLTGCTEDYPPPRRRRTGTLRVGAVSDHRRLQDRALEYLPIVLQRGRKNCMAPCARERSETGCQFYLDPNVANFTRPREAKFHACNSHITCIVIASVKLESMQRRWRSRDRGLDREPAPLQWHQQLGFDSGCTHVFADRCRLVQNERERERETSKPCAGFRFRAGARAPAHVVHSQDANSVAIIGSAILRVIFVAPLLTEHGIPRAAAAMCVLLVR